MRRIGTPRSNLKLTVPPQETPISEFLTASGTFKDEDFLVNREGLKVIYRENTPSPALLSPDGHMTLEDFNIVRVIGKGSGGVVQLVQHKWTDQFFALKIIQMNIQEDLRKQIVREIKINQASQCPYVVVCHHAFYNNGVISILLEYMDGGSLADVIKDFRRLPEPCLAVICTQVLRGLVYLHQDRQVIHRDIKPSNLLVNHKGEVKITDFGVSAILTNSMGQRDTFVGTCNYMSPERVVGGTYGYDSDIWSLGLVILECALGRFPYIPPGKGESWANFFELLETIVGQPAPCAPSDQFSPEFCSFISNSVQKVSRNRLSALDLLHHPFIRKYEKYGTSVLADFIRDWSPIS